MKYKFFLPSWGKYVEFILALGVLYLLMLFGFGRVGFDTWILHPAIPLVALFAARYGFVIGLSCGAFSMAAYALLELPAKPIDVARLDHLSEFLLLLSVIGATALVFGLIRDRSARRVAGLKRELEERQRQNEKLRQFVDEAVSNLKQHDIERAFGNTQKTLRLFGALDAVYLSNRKSVVRDISNLLDEIVPGIHFTFLDINKKPVLSSQSRAPKGARSPLAAANHAKGLSIVEVRAPVELPDILPEARWLVLSTQSGISANDLETCLKVIHRCLIRDKLILDFGAPEIRKRAS